MIKLRGAFMADEAAGYGDRLLPVWRAIWKDYRKGDGSRARARRGFLTPPGDRGRLIWVKAGGTPEDVRLGIELLGAVRDKRHDVRIVLTFEQDYPALFERHMQPFRKVGVGYGPCDRPRVVRRVLERFQPHGILLAGGQPPANLLRSTAVPVIAVNTAPPVGTVPAVAGFWPVDAKAEQGWPPEARGTTLPPADPQARFVEAQADVVLRSLVGGRVERLWWWHGTAGDWPAWQAAWQASGWGGTDILLASLHDVPEAPRSELPGADLAISGWDRSPLAPGTILHLDDRRWLAAAASAAHAVHLAAPDRQALWQGLAGGAAVSLGEAPDAKVPCPVLDAPDAVLGAWNDLRDDPAARRQQGDEARRRFWEERRQVDANFDAVLQQVWDW